VAETTASIELGLLSRLTDLILCSGCLRRGRATPVVQVVSRRHRPRALCPECRRAIDPAHPSCSDKALVRLPSGGA
jgi:hypothetical protein